MKWMRVAGLGIALVLMLLDMGVARAEGDSAPTAFERDREAILDMAGEYKVTFRFEESVPLKEGYTLAKPYNAWGREIVEVIRDDGRTIRLQHILLVDGTNVVKHWRQDWTYEDAELYEYVAHLTWRPRRRSEEDVKGMWSQKVYQVDDSPRYAGWGRWTHRANLSYWESEQTWRPLPRRERTKRDDYDVLVSRNRHTLTPFGWVHEQDNYKLVMGGGEEPILAREFGLNQYERIDDHDFSPCRAYWTATKAFWAIVRGYWERIFEQGKPVQLRESVGGKKMYEYLLPLADTFAADAQQDLNRYEEEFGEVLESFLITPELPADQPADGL